MAYYLLKLYHENGNASINQTSFAKYLGKSRITVNKVIQKWKEQNLIELKKRKIELKDFRAIKAIANNEEKV
jgi:CRP/FNR family cyclic AMP-dependent transcriptional regulator